MSKWLKCATLQELEVWMQTSKQTLTFMVQLCEKKQKNIYSYIHLPLFSS